MEASRVWAHACAAIPSVSCESRLFQPALAVCGLGERRVPELSGSREDLAAGLAEGGWGSYRKQLEGWRARVEDRGHVETARAGEPIAIRDGSTYIGLLPLTT